MKKLLSVNVGWKYTISQVIKSETSSDKIFNVKFISIKFEGEDLKGKTKWPDNQWVRLSLKEFKKQKGFEPEVIKDEYVNRIYST
jgi:hypothetical protein